MNIAIQTIAATLEKLFKEQGAKIVDGDLNWALGRRDAVVAFRNTDEYRKIKSNAWLLYEQLHAIAGGKTWYAVVNGSEASIRDFISKNAAATAAKRNAKVAAQLLKAGVESVETATVRYTQDGFCGTFVINGNRCVTIDVVLAGGHNIQRLHQRVLCKVK